MLIKNSSDLVSTLEEVNDRHSGVAIELQSIKKLMKTREASIKALTDNLLENFDEATVQSLCDHVGIKVSSKAKHETMISKLRIKFEEDHEGLLSYLQKKKSSTKKQKSKTKKKVTATATTGKGTLPWAKKKSKVDSSSEGETGDFVEDGNESDF